MGLKYSKISGITIVSCDHEYEVRFPGEGGCGEQFRSCSDKNVIPKQLELARWELVEVMDERGNATKQYLCPHHAEIVRKRQSSVARYQTRST